MSTSPGESNGSLAVINAAENFLAGKAGVIETARAIADVYGEIVPEWSDDPAFLVVGRIASESDGLPVGDARALWAPEALAERDRLTAIIETEDRPDLEIACRLLLDRYRGD